MRAESVTTPIHNITNEYETSYSYEYPFQTKEPADER